MEIKSIPNKAELDKWTSTLGGRLHLIHVDVKCLQHIIDFVRQTPITSKKFNCIFSYFYRMFFDRMYINIYKLLDKRKDVMILKNFLKKLDEADQWKEIEKHTVYQKIEKKRHEQIAHDNQILALNQDVADKHHEQNKLHLSEIISFLEFIQKKFEAVIAKKGEAVFHYAWETKKRLKNLKSSLN